MQAFNPASALLGDRIPYLQENCCRLADLHSTLAGRQCKKVFHRRGWRSGVEGCARRWHFLHLRSRPRASTAGPRALKVAATRKRTFLRIRRGGARAGFRACLRCRTGLQWTFAIPHWCKRRVRCCLDISEDRVNLADLAVQIGVSAGISSMSGPSPASIR